MATPRPAPVFSEHARHWILDPQVVFLNHGSYGACPQRVLEFQRHIQEQMEREPLRFMGLEREPLLDHARESLATFLNADPEGLAFVPNATTAVNAVFRSIVWKPGDEILVTNHEYNACMNALRWTIERACDGNVRIVTANIPFPIRSADEAVDAVRAAITPRTRLALISHVTSPTALVLPAERLTRELASRGVPSLIDGAHAPGMIPLNLRELDATWYVGNCHKWMCAPKGAGFLYINNPAQRDAVAPVVISHGLNSTRTDQSRFRLLFDWTGTDDYSACIAVPEAIRTIESILPGGWTEVMRSNREKTLRARDLFCSQLGCNAPAPDDMIGSIVTIPLPSATHQPGETDPQFGHLYRDFKIQAPLIIWPEHPTRWIRLSGQLYNDPSQYEFALSVIRELLAIR